jgi:hypothetical protein
MAIKLTQHSQHDVTWGVVTHNGTPRKWNKTFIGGTNSWLSQQILKSMFSKDVLNILNLQFLPCKTTNCYKSSTCHYVRFWHCLPSLSSFLSHFPTFSLPLTRDVYLYQCPFSQLEEESSNCINILQ